MINVRRLGIDLLALALLAATLFVGMSLAGYNPADPPATTGWPPSDEVLNYCGPVGAKVAHGLMTSFGLASWLILLTMLTVDLRLFAHRKIGNWPVQLAGWLLSLSCLSVTLALLIPRFGEGPPIGSGGYIGAWGSAILSSWFSTAGTFILVGAALAAGLMMSSETSFLPIAMGIAAFPVRILSKLRRRRVREQDVVLDEAAPDQMTDASPDASVDEDTAADATPVVEVAVPPVVPASDDAQADASLDEPRPPIRINPPVTAKRSGRDEIMSRLDSVSNKAGDGRWALPDLAILEDAEEFPYDLLSEKARVAAETLERTFQEFGLNVRVSEIDTGPVVTQYELELEAGLRLSKITALGDDLAIALRVPSVRIVAPIPGKNTVGVEVPNETQVMVRLRELIESCPDDVEKKRIPIFLGKDVSGRPLAIDMTKMPHLLIAGRTGTGKSVCLNALILSMLMTRSPDDVKLVMIDPKMVELSPYTRVPHLMHPVITDMKKAEAVLAWAVDKMEERYDLLARCRVRHLDGYNNLGKEKVLERLEIDPDDPEQMLEADAIPEKMPYIVIIADEMADMMMTSGKDVEGHIIRLAQKSRAVGIHLVLATQKPTVDVITGLIKSNLPARISFQVASRTDSRVVLDESGADRLLGNGDMLYLAPGTSNITRAQGAFVSDNEVNEVIEFYSNYDPEYSTELAQVSASAGTKGLFDTDADRDELYEEAVEVVIREQLGSVSRLQRFLGIGYGRAARLVDYMAEDGIVGDYNGSKAREVLYTPEEWDALKSQSGDRIENALEEELEPAGAA